MNTTPNYDIIVLGAGPAGYSAAIRAAQLGARVLLADKGAIGGTCLNRGCIPTKFLWEAVTLGKKMKRGAEYGISGAFSGFDVPAMQQRKTRAAGILSRGIGKLLEGHGITLVAGSASFRSRDTVEIAGADGAVSSASAPRIIIATGSEPKPLPGLPFDHKKIIDSTDALDLQVPPAKFLIIGGGAIGIELAVIYANLGSEVALIEREKQLLPGEDAELARAVTATLQRLGVNVTTGSGSFESLLPQFDTVLVVTGRTPSLDGLALDRAGIAATPYGITVNEFLETSVPGIYAAGDAAGRACLAYTAQAEGIIAAENARGAREEAPDCRAVPRVVFCQPPAASVGIRETEAPSADISVGRFPLAANARAFIEGERGGWVKLLADRTSGKVLGGQVFGPHAEDLIAVISLAIAHGMKVRDLRRELFFHPSLSETIHNAAEALAGTCVELPPGPPVVK
jgi:dihydrolipoamide dehydrogenase